MEALRPSRRLELSRRLWREPEGRGVGGKRQSDSAEVLKEDTASG